MSHYYTKDDPTLKSARKPIFFELGGRVFRMTTDSGVFSRAGLDFGTRTMLENLAVTPGEELLDLGCGIGVVGIVAGALFGARVAMTDVNERAVALAAENAAACGVDARVYAGDGCLHVPGLFDVVVLNPPIRAGKAVVYRLFREAREKLRDGGRFVCVVNKNQGAESASRELEAVFGNVATVARKSGYHVFVCRK